jgi:hypothetical protein
MPATAINYTKITGITPTDNTTGTGTWETGVDLDSFVTVPSGATAAVMLVVNTSGSSRWAGVRQGGKTTAHFLQDINFGTAGTLIIPLGSGNTLDFYAESTSTSPDDSSPVEFYLAGFLGDEWTWFDIDGAAVTLTDTVASFATRTVSDASASANIVVGLSANALAWRPTGESTSLSANARGHHLMRLNASKQVDIRSSSDARVFGYTTTGATGVTWNTWLGTTLSYTADSTWRDGSTSSGNAFAYIQFDEAVSTYAQRFRRNGDTWAIPSGGGESSIFESHFAPCDASGQFEYYIETGETAAAYLHGWLNTDASADPPRPISLYYRTLGVT